MTSHQIHTPTSRLRSSISASASPLRAVLALTFTNSLGSAVLNTGIFFLAEQRFGFSSIKIFALACLYGVVYIPATLLVGPLLRTCRNSSSFNFSTRSVLFLLMILMGSVCFVPWLVAGRLASVGSASSAGGWTIWFLVALYSPLSGMLWPITEHYISGGRSGQSLRSATGLFNISWSTALVAALLVMSPFVKKSPLMVLSALGLIHFLNLLILTRFRPEPGEHIHEEHEPHPPEYTQLLSYLRILLPTAFMFLAALAPYLTTVQKQLKLDISRGPILGATWMLARVFTFIIMQRWHGWHGRWLTPTLGVLFLLLGFAAIILGPLLLPPGDLPLDIVLAGLGCFGIGVGIIYCAALYYAMEVGSSNVDAGGTHEMLIGLGYTVGPGVGLAAFAFLREPAATHAMLAGISALAIIATTYAFVHARIVVNRNRRSRASTSNSSPS